MLSKPVKVLSHVPLSLMFECQISAQNFSTSLGMLGDIQLIALHVLHM